MTLTIDELVLSGFPVASRHRLADAFAEELRMLPWEGLSSVEVPPPLNLRLRKGDSPERVGREIARALHAAITGGGS